MTDELDDFFTAAREAGPAPSGALAARVLADADAAMPRPAETVAAVRRPRWRQFLAAIGGGVVVSGLASAAMAGVFIGYAGPVTSDWLGTALTGSEDVQMISASDLFLGEG